MTTSRPNVLSAAVGLLVFALVLWARQVFNDGDTWWHVEAGRVMLAERTILRTDPFSHTMGGQPWPSHEWLSEVLFALAFNLAGWSGLTLMVAATAGVSAWMFAREVGRRLTGLPHLCLVVLSLTLFAPHLLVRPHILALPLLVIWAIELVRARDEDRGPRWALLPLMALWANLHGGFMFGLALVGPFALEALLAAPADRRIPVALRWGGFGLAAAGMALLTPHGLSGLLFPLKHSSMWALSYTNEWLAADFSSPSPLMFALLAGVFVALTRPLAVSPIRALLLVGLLYASLTHIRHEQMLGLMAGLILAAPMARAYGQTGEPTAPTRRSRIVLAACAGLAIAVLAVARLTVPVTWTDSRVTPISALDAVPEHVRATPVLNAYGFGGYLIWRQVRPYVDSRAELYGDDFLKAYLRLSEGDATQLDRALREHRIGWTILEPASPLARAMDARPGWRRLYADQWAVVHVADRAGAARR